MVLVHPFCAHAPTQQRSSIPDTREAEQGLDNLMGTIANSQDVSVTLPQGIEWKGFTKYAVAIPP